MHIPSTEKHSPKTGKFSDKTLELIKEEPSLFGKQVIKAAMSFLSGLCASSSMVIHPQGLRDLALRPCSL